MGDIIITHVKEYKKCRFNDMHMSKERDVIMHNIKVSDLSFKYTGGDKMILKDISVDVEPGEFVCVLGQSGCGKSTFLRLLAGLEKPTTGTIEMNGKEITGAGLDRGVVFQDYGLFPWMTAGENIMLALYLKVRLITQ